MQTNRTTPTEAEEILDVAGAAAFLHVSRAVLYEEIAGGRLKSFKIKNRRLFRKSHLLEFVAACEAATEAAGGAFFRAGTAGGSAA